MRPDEIGLKATILAIREEMMCYFKGTCVERLASGNVGIYPTGQNANYTYERRHNDIVYPCKLVLGNVRLFNLQREPAVITFNVSALERSPQLRQIRKEIEKFVDNYLPNVAKEYTGEKPNRQRDDKELVESGSLRNKEEELMMTDRHRMREAYEQYISETLSTREINMPSYAESMWTSVVTDVAVDELPF